MDGWKGGAVADCREPAFEFRLLVLILTEEGGTVCENRRAVNCYLADCRLGSRPFLLPLLSACESTEITLG